MSAEPTPTAALLVKLNEVAKAIPFVEKRGNNSKQNYNFVQATDVLRDTRAQLQARGVVVVPGIVPGSLKHLHGGEGGTGGRSFVTTFDMTYTFMDSETGASIVVPWIGAGSDLGGEKGVYKAMTGALKYVLLQLFMLPTSDDPENDALSYPDQDPAPAAAPVAANSPSAGKDAERPAAPPIPLDRARLIVEAAVAAGLATESEDPKAPFTFSPLLKAQLQTVGVSKVGELNSDQAETVESFIRDEAAAGVPA